MKAIFSAVAWLSCPLLAAACFSGGGGGGGVGEVGGGGETASRGGSNAAGGGGAAGSGVNQGGSSGEPSCDEACSDLYTCGEGQCAGWEKNGGTVTQVDFVLSCVDSCKVSPAVKALVDPSDCDKTITSLKAVNMDFANSCNGIGAGGNGGV